MLEYRNIGVSETKFIAPPFHYSNVPRIQFMTSHLVKQILKGDVRAVASFMSLIEDGGPKVKAVLKAVYPHTGRAHVIGVTGAAGTGKSRLTDRMTAEYRRRKKSVGILGGG